MIKIDDLMNKLCPNGVEYKTIQELCTISRGRVMSKDYIRDNSGDYPVYSSQTENNGELGEISTYDFDGEYLTWTTDGANAGSVFYRNGKFSVTNVCGLLEVIDNEITTKFLYYILSVEAPKYVNAGMGNPKLMSNVMAKIKVAVPPLEVQCEIVHILDDFTLLSAELSAELKARQKQYEYYENELFDFDNNNIEYTKIDFEEIATFSQGIQVDVNKQYYEPFENRVPFLRIVDFVNDNEPPRYIEKPNDKYIKKENEMIMIRYGASAAGKVFLNKYGAIANNMFKINLKEKSSINLKYLMYYLSQNKIYKLLNSSGKSTMPAINFGFLGKLKIDIPSIKEQERIVNTLDRFDKLCNDISEGLPAEIEARQKQYEYYRDKLLTFKELKVNE